jgi:antitoxin component YwqK of YwqJK toxin-antitoxin module
LERCSLQNQRKLVIGESIARLYNNDMKKLLTAVFAALLLVGCGKEDLDDPETRNRIIAEAIEEGKLRLKWKQGELLDYAPEQQMPYSGWTKSFYDDGQIKALTRHQHGKKDGLSIKWHENGQKSLTARFREDKPVKFWIKWHKNGKKAGEFTFKYGYQNGPQTQWYSNGQKSQEGNYASGKPNGLLTEWHENGQKSSEVNYKFGKTNGLLMFWYENGQQSHKGNVKEGKLRTAVAWMPNGEKCPFTKIDQDLNGAWVWYNADGTEKSRDIYKDGKSVKD